VSFYYPVTKTEFKSFTESFSAFMNIRLAALLLQASGKVFGKLPVI
jgi:hypothetical protein